MVVCGCCVFLQRRGGQWWPLCKRCDHTHLSKHARKCTASGAVRAHTRSRCTRSWANATRCKRGVAAELSQLDTTAPPASSALAEHVTVVFIVRFTAAQHACAASTQQREKLFNAREVKRWCFFLDRAGGQRTHGQANTSTQVARRSPACETVFTQLTCQVLTAPRLPVGQLPPRPTPAATAQAPPAPPPASSNAKASRPWAVSERNGARGAAEARAARCPTMVGTQLWQNSTGLEKIVRDPQPEGHIIRTNIIKCPHFF